MAQPNVLDIYRQFCLKFILSGLQSVVGKPKTVVTDAAQYQNLIVYPIWNMLPLPIRLMDHVFPAREFDGRRGNAAVVAVH